MKTKRSAVTSGKTLTRSADDARLPKGSNHTSTAKSKTIAVSRERSIQSIERAVAILEAVANHPEGINLADLSTQLSLHNSTVFHLVKTLMQLGMVDQVTDTKRYRIGSRLFMLAAGALDESAMLFLATPVLERLSRETGETAHLAVRSRDQIVVIAKTAAAGLLQLSGQSGASRPAHATAIGKVLLAEAPPSEYVPLLETLFMQRFTEHTITDKDTLHRELEDIRRQGIAYDNGEFDGEVKCVAVPVRDFAKRCVAAIGISGPVWRLSPARLRKKTLLLQAAASDLSALLGYRDDRAGGQRKKP